MVIIRSTWRSWHAACLKQSRSALAKLRWRCDPESLGFRTTEELSPLAGIIGQERAQKALTLGIEIAKSGYNIYVSGMTGTGKLTAVQQLLAAREGERSSSPRSVLRFSLQESRASAPTHAAGGAGQGAEKSLEGLLHDLKHEIPRVLTTESVQQQKKAHLQQAQRRGTTAHETVQRVWGRSLVCSGVTLICR